MGQRADVGSILEVDAKRAWPDHHSVSWRMLSVEDRRKRLTLARRFAFDFDKSSHVHNRIEYDEERFRRLQRHAGLLAGGQFDRVEDNFLKDPVECFIVWQIDARTPENLTIELDEQATCADYARRSERTFGLTVNVTSTISSSVGS